MSTVRIVGTVPLRPNWTGRLTPESWSCWARLEALLRADPKWASDQVDSVAAESLRILRHMHDPMSPYPFQGRGLVVGYVLSRNWRGANPGVGRRSISNPSGIR